MVPPPAFFGRPKIYSKELLNVTVNCDPFERHFTSRELAQTWKLDETTIRRMFQDEAGVMKIGKSGRRDKRDYVTLRIPESVAARVYRQKAA
jgi:hypothetical protein